jgi:prolyl-tRNA synthetase
MAFISFVQGVPLRLEIGPNDIAKQQTISVRRDNGNKDPIPLANISESVSEFLKTIQKDMFNRAKELYDTRVITVTNWDDLVPALDNKCVVAIPWCDAEVCEDDIKERSGRA